MFMQSGLTVKWRKETVFYFKLDFALKHHKKGRESRTRISLKHLEMAFVGLLMGHLLGAFVFLLEKCQDVRRRSLERENRVRELIASN